MSKEKCCLFQAVSNSMSKEEDFGEKNIIQGVEMRDCVVLWE
jgi:hypothetical protein